MCLREGGECWDHSCYCSGMEFVDQVVLSDLKFLFYAVTKVPIGHFESVLRFGAKPCERVDVVPHCLYIVALCFLPYLIQYFVVGSTFGLLDICAHVFVRVVPLEVLSKDTVEVLCGESWAQLLS